MLIEFLGEILVEGVAYGTYGLMELFLDSLYKGWNKTLKKLLCVLMGITMWILINVEVLMIEKDYDLNDIVEMKKEHPCHKSKYWKIIRMGADIRIKCLGCGTSVLFPRVQFEKKLKRIIEKAPGETNEN